MWLYLDVACQMSVRKADITKVEQVKQRSDQVQFDWFIQLDSMEMIHRRLQMFACWRSWSWWSWNIWNHVPFTLRGLTPTVAAIDPPINPAVCEGHWCFTPSTSNLGQSLLTPPGCPPSNFPMPQVSVTGTPSMLPTTKLCLLRSFHVSNAGLAIWSWLRGALSLR